MNNSRVCLVQTSSNKLSKRSVYDDYKKNPNKGIMYLRCPQTGSEFTIPFNNEKERLEWIEVKKEIREEMRLVS